MKPRPLLTAVSLLLLWAIPFILGAGDEQTYLVSIAGYDPEQKKHGAPTHSAVNSNKKELAILRTALYQYVLAEGRFPERLEDLAAPFPANYLSSILKEQTTKSSKVSSQYTGDGGWVYKKPAAVSTRDLKRQIAKTLMPNVPSPPYPFTPVHLVVSKEAHTLTMLAGTEPLASFPVGLGENNATPEGTFTIAKRVLEPNSQLPNTQKPYGTRGMELSNPTYAIHGTYAEDSVGKNQSKGCIRLKIGDMEKLYAMTPLFTPVTILKGAQVQGVMPPAQAKQASLSKAVAAPGGAAPKHGQSPSREKDNETVYHWAF